MRQFWLDIGWPVAAWLVFLIYADERAMTIGLFSCALFWACHFLHDLFRERQLAAFILHVGSLAAVYAPLYASGSGVSDSPHGSSQADIALWFALFVSTYATWRYSMETRRGWSTAIIASSACSLVAYAILQEQLRLLPYLLLFDAAYVAVWFGYRRAKESSSEATARYDALLDEYRKLKRDTRSNEEAARIAERTYIARRIHDSVGHKLTSLLMQLETFRMQASEENRPIAEQMKRLAQESLQETRSAVKALQNEEPGGIQALLRLIRNLEAESFMQVDFVVRQGALSVVLDNDQSAAVYRSIQEALTNAMRHGSSRKVSILLESPGGSIFRFEVSNETREGQDEPIQEGFGLTAMRDRIKSAGGELEIARRQGMFIIRGTFVLKQ
jgi:signal transduction histidine kinase